MHPPDTKPPRPRRRRADHDPNHSADGCTGSCDDLDAIDDRLDRGAVRMDGLEVQVTAIKADVEEVLDILRLGKSFFRLAGYVGSLVKWGVAIGAPIVAFYWSLKGGKP